MTVYARSDVAAVSISPDHGGCGQSHSRPAPGGKPVKLWAFTCHGGCEDFLRSDSLWSSTPQTIPETPDEVSTRTDIERRGQLENQTNMAQALNDLAKLGNLPEVLAEVMRSMSGHQAPAVSTMAIMCRNGHRNESTVKFCGECGASMDDAMNRGTSAGALTSGDVNPETVTNTPESLASEDEVLDSADLENLTLAELRTIAAREGAEIARSKKDQAALILKNRN